MNRLSGKVAIVTGAGSGMGESHARMMAAQGARIIATDIREEAAARVSSDLGENAISVQHDVASEESWAVVLKRATEAFGPVNVLVNNAAVAPLDTIEEFDQPFFLRTLAINTNGVALGMNAVFASMREAGGGSIVNISSVGGLRGSGFAFSYSTSKFAVTGMTKSAAIAYAKHGIRVNSVHPGWIDTPMLRGNIDDDGVAETERRVPLGRLGTPAELSHLVIFLASDEASYCTGSEFVADGGLLCQA